MEKVYEVVERKIVFREVPDYSKKMLVKGNINGESSYKYKTNSLDVINNYPRVDYKSATTRIVVDTPLKVFDNKETAIKYATFIKSSNFRNSNIGLRDTMDNLIETGDAEVEQGVSHNIMVKEIEVFDNHFTDKRKTGPIYCIADLWMNQNNMVIFPVINVWYGELTEKEKNRISFDYLKSHKEYDVFRDKIDSNYNSLTQYTVIHEKDIHNLRAKAMMNYIKDKFIDMIPNFKEYINKHSEIVLNSFDIDDLYLSKKFDNVDYDTNWYNKEKFDKQFKFKKYPSNCLIQTL